MNLADILRAEGVTVREVDGWQHRRRAGAWTPRGVMFHHTAGHDALTVIVNGRADLAGPLADVYLDKQACAWVVSDGRCNHAGRGAASVLARVRRDEAPLAPAAKLGLVDDTDGNAWFYGVEMENLGDGHDPWPAAQLDAAARIGAAICRHYGWSAGRNIAHLEWTRRKVDPRGFPMSSLRALVVDRLGVIHPAPVPHRRRPTVFLVQHPNGVVELCAVVAGNKVSHVGIEDPADRDSFIAAGVPLIPVTDATWKIWAA